MFSRKTNDLKLGMRGEKKSLPMINTHFNFNLRKLQGKYSVFDFKDVDNMIYCELKTRRCESTQYPTIMVGYNKILKGFQKIEKGYRVIIVWKFTDGLMYFELTKKSFNYDWVNHGHLARSDRGKAELSDLAFIPCNLLIPIY
tara:strand:- start:473 stop:901 length:429 start_codon:yes stop_codon:yes gene_type:complete